jgi:hypothetical protein
LSASLLVAGVKHDFGVVNFLVYHAAPDREGPPSLIEIIRSCYQSECGNRVDRLYGVQGLLDAKHQITIDYSKSASEVFIDGAIVLLQTGRPMDYDRFEALSLLALAMGPIHLANKTVLLACLIMVEWISRIRHVPADLACAPLRIGLQYAVDDSIEGSAQFDGWFRREGEHVGLLVHNWQDMLKKYHAQLMRTRRMSLPGRQNEADAQWLRDNSYPTDFFSILKHDIAQSMKGARKSM